MLSLAPVGWASAEHQTSLANRLPTALESAPTDQEAPSRYSQPLAVVPAPTVVWAMDFMSDTLYGGCRGTLVQYVMPAFNTGHRLTNRPSPCPDRSRFAHASYSHSSEPSTAESSLLTAALFKRESSRRARQGYRTSIVPQKQLASHRLPIIHFDLEP